MRIIDLQEAAFPVQSTMRNAVFSFAEMTTSIVAVRLDPGSGATPVTGYAFNSTGRYACGAQMRDRFIPRLLKAPPDSLLDEQGRFDPAKALACMLRGEKPGGHTERSVAIGTIVQMWTATVLTRLFTSWWYRATRPKELPVFQRPGLSLYDRLRRPLFRIFPDDTRIPFMRAARMGLIVSAILSTASVAIAFYPGLEKGIDFKAASRWRCARRRPATSARCAARSAR